MVYFSPRSSPLPKARQDLCGVQWFSKVTEYITERNTCSVLYHQQDARTSNSSTWLAEGPSEFRETTVRFIRCNFYVDDGLTSVDSEAEAIQLVQETRDLCSTGKLCLHKFTTSSKMVLATIPKEECAEGATDLDMALGELKMERALGVQWCISSDKFQFRVVGKEHPFTRRGIVSTETLIFDPLGFVSHCNLKGKQILRRMCQDKLRWDEPLPDNLKQHWEVWLQDLHKLSLVEISRCYIPLTEKEVKQYGRKPLFTPTPHHGVCSYLNAVSKSGE